MGWRYGDGRRGRRKRGKVLVEVGVRDERKGTELSGKGRTQRKKLRGRADRSWGYEKSLQKGRASELARRCWEEMGERCKEGKTSSSLEEERKSFLRQEE